MNNFMKSLMLLLLAINADGQILITNWVKAPASYRTVSNQVYDVNLSKEWETMELPAGRYVVKYLGSPGMPADLRLVSGGFNRDFTILHFPYDPKDFLQVGSDATVAPAHYIKCRVLALSPKTNYTAAGQMIRTVKFYDYGLQMTNPIAQVAKLDPPVKRDDQYRLALRYFNGTGVAKDPLSARQWLTAAMTNGSPEASNAFKKFFGSEPPK